MISDKPIHAQVVPSPEYQLKAVFLFNFTHFIEWPPIAFDSYNDPFYISIVGTDPFGSYLDQTVAGEMIGRHPIRIKRYSDIKDLQKSHIVFINARDMLMAANTLEDLNKQNILTVSDADHFAENGGIIGFFTENNRIKMQVNSNAAKYAQLIISSKLLRVCKIL